MSPTVKIGDAALCCGYVWREARTGDPAGSSVPDHTKLAFECTTTLGSDVHLLQVVAIGRHVPGPGCRIP